MGLDSFQPPVLLAGQSIPAFANQGDDTIEGLVSERGVTDFTQEPTDNFYGTDVGVRDPFGNAIGILQYKKVAHTAKA